MGGITPSPGEESKLKQNGKSYKNQLLESEWNLVLIIFIDGLIPPPWIEGYFFIDSRKFR